MAIHLFVLCPPASGSTLLWKILKTSPHVSALPREGQGLVQDELFTADRWNPGKKINWEIVRTEWGKHWDASKPVLLEKSPPHLVRAGQLLEHFDSCRFIVMMRDPYAFAEGIRRRWRKRSSYYAIARFWKACARFQRTNLEQLRPILLLTFEELTRDPELACRRMIDLVPELERLDVGGDFVVFEKAMPVTNLNDRQIAALSLEDLFSVNQALRGCPELLKYFGYELRQPANPLSFPGLRSLLIRAAALGHSIGPERWMSWK